MIEISKELSDMMQKEFSHDCEKLGYICEYGAVVGDAEFIIYVDDDGKSWLTHTTEYNHFALGLRLKDKK
jgi:hypothetical protein